MNSDTYHIILDDENSDGQNVNKLVERGKRQTISRVTHTLQLLEKMKNQTPNNSDSAIDTSEEYSDKMSVSRKELEISKLRELVSINKKNALYYDVDQTDVNMDDINDILNENMSKEKFSQLYKILLDIYKPQQSKNKDPSTKETNTKLSNITIKLKVILDDLTINQRVIKTLHENIGNFKCKVIQKLPEHVSELKDKLVFYIPSSGIYLDEDRSLSSYLIKDNDELILKIRKDGTPESVLVQVQKGDLESQTVNFYPQTTVFGILQSLNKEYNEKWKKGHYHLIYNQKPLLKNDTLYSYGIKNGSTLVLIKKKELSIEDPIKNELIKLKLTVNSPEANKETIINECPGEQNVSYLIKELFMKISLENAYWNEYGLFLENNVDTWIDDSYPIEYLIKKKINYAYLLRKPDYGLRKVELGKQPQNYKLRKKKFKKTVPKNPLPRESTEKHVSGRKRIKLYEIAIEILVPDSKKIAKKIRLSKKETGKKIKSLLQSFMPEGEDLNDYSYILPFVNNIEMPEHCTIIPFLKAYMGDKPITLNDRIQLIKK